MSGLSYSHFLTNSSTLAEDCEKLIGDADALDTLIRGTRKALSKELQYYHVSLEWSGPIKKPCRREEKKELHVYETLEEGVAQ